jgi:NAD(P)-dependent dehydrogenase (short-subunit alcohol dehydrogenase family)
MPLAEKSVVITGAGRGIGQACARLASRLGAAVIVNDLDAAAARRTAAEIVENGGKAAAETSDVSSWQGAASVVEACLDQFGRLDGLVNNAAIVCLEEFEKFDEATWRSIIQVNVLGVAFMMSHAVRQMLRQGRGSIVNMTSGAHQGAANLAAYGASKGAVASLTYCAALDLGARGIRVNAVSPVAATRMAETATAYWQARGQPGMVDPPSAEANAPAVCFLLSDKSSAYNGQIIRVDKHGLSLVKRPTAQPPCAVSDNRDYAAVSHVLLAELLSQTT